jgi:hypothetical protein
MGIVYLSGENTGRAALGWVETRLRTQTWKYRTSRWQEGAVYMLCMVAAVRRPLFP